MKSFVFSIGEKTTDLTCELMRTYGFDVILYKDQTSLWDKLRRFYLEALESSDNEFVRIDADIIPNHNVKILNSGNGWTCASGWDWYKQDVGAISVHCMSKQVIKDCLKYIDEAKNMNRPESYLWRLSQINEKTELTEFACGMHGYGQQDQRRRIQKLKSDRGQEYRWGLIERIENL